MSLVSNRRAGPSLAVTGAALALAATLPTIGWLGLAADEWITLDAIARNVPALIEDRLANAHSPFYFLLLKAGGLDAGASDTLLRLPSALFHALTAALIALAAARLSGRLAGIVAATLVALAPVLLELGQITRPYTQLNFFLALTFYALSIPLRAPRLTEAAFRGGRTGDQSATTVKRAGALAAIGAIGAGYTMNIGILAIVLITVAPAAMPSIRRRKAFLRLWLAGCALIWIALLPLVLAQISALSGFAANYWVERAFPLSLEQFAGVTARVFGFSVPSDPDRFLRFGWHVLPAGMVATLALLTIIRDRRPAMRLAAVLAIGLPLLLILASTIQSVMLWRYFAPAFLPYAILAANGAALACRLLPLPLAGGAIASLLAMTSLQGADAATANRTPDWRAPAFFLDRQSYGVVSGLAEHRMQVELLRRYAPPGLSIDLEVEADTGRRHRRLAALLETEPFVWDFARAAIAAPATDPEQAVACSFLHAGYRLTVIARQPDSLPPSLRDCARDSGTVLDWLRRTSPSPAP